MKKEEIRTRLLQLKNICHDYNLKDLSERIDSQMKLIDEPLRIMIVGEGKSGKSSLLNALVEATVAEVDYEPKTWCIGVYASTKGEPYAEVVYKDSMIRTSIDEAKKIMEEYESNYENRDSVKDIEKLREIEEIRWYLNIKWPDEGMVIIDTPGFLQGRADTEIIETKIDGIEGVKFLASDGFEKYYSKSDLVLWCFEATDVGAADVVDKLESVKSQDKNIYGIVTKLDKFESDAEREEAFRRNNNVYRKYIKQCIRSQLPPIRKKDAGEKLNRKLILRTNTVDGIRRCITYLLADNKAVDLKLKSYEIFCKNIERLIAVYLDKYVSFYYSNYEVLKDVRNKFNKEVDSIRRSSINKICQILEDKENGFLIGKEYDSLWHQCDEQPKTFATVLMANEKNSGFMNECNQLQKSFCSSIQDTVLYHEKGIKWNVIKIGSKNETLQTAEFKFNFTGKNIDFNDLVIDIKKGFWDDFLSLFNRNGVLYSIINEFIGNKRKEKTFTKIRETFVLEIASVREQYLKQINYNYQQCINEFGKALENMFDRITGIHSCEVEMTILKIDEVMSSMKLYPSNTPYFPYYKDKKLYFARNPILLKIRTFQEKNKSEDIVEYVRKNFIQKAFESRIKKDERTIKSELTAYNGTKSIRKNFETPDFYHDSILNTLVVFWQEIEWGVCENKIKDAYLMELDRYLKTKDEIWSDYSERALECVINFYMKKWEKYLIEPVIRFIDSWQKQCVNSFQKYKQYDYFMCTPQDWDIKYYFQIDQRYNVDPVIYNFILFMSDNKVKYVGYQNVSLVTPDGDDASDVINKQIEEKYSKFVTAINRIQSQNKEEWDAEVRSKSEQIKRELSKHFDEIQQLIEEDVFPRYKQYLISMGDSKHKKSLSEYILICGRLNKEQMELMKGNVLNGVFGRNLDFSFFDGTRIYDDIKKYIQDKSKSINYMVKEKMLNGK